MRIDETARVDLAAIATGLVGVLLIILGRALQAVDNNLAEFDN